jgi:hypothetical protein
VLPFHLLHESLPFMRASLTGTEAGQTAACASPPRSRIAHKSTTPSVHQEPSWQSPHPFQFLPALTKALGPLASKRCCLWSGTPAQYTSECQNPTNKRIASLIVVETVGRLKVRGLRPAVASLRGVLADIEREAPEVYGSLGHVGMLCARLVRGSITSINLRSG